VTLLEGKVTVTPAGESVPATPAPSGSAGTSAAAYGKPMGSGAAPDVTLTPGQRLTFADHDRPTLDRPELDRVTAWQRGRVILDHTPLVNAVAEMNRYSEVALKIEDPEAGRAEVTGIFRVGDSENFAQAVAETYHLQVADRAGQIVLSGLPKESGGEVNEK